MKVDEKTVSILSKLGLNKYEIDGYIALVPAGKLTASEVSGASGIPSARVYDVMDSLEKKGFVMIGIGRPTTYQAVPPEEALSNYKERLKKEYEKSLSQFDANANAVLSSLAPLWKKGITLKKPHEVFTVKEDEDISITIDKMLRRASSDICLLADGSVLSFVVTNYIAELESAASNKISIKLLAPAEADSSVIKSLSKVGSTRTIPEPPSSFCLVDNSDLLLIQRFSDFREEVKGRGLWTNSTMIVKTFGWMFESIWEYAKPYKV